MDIIFFLSIDEIRLGPHFGMNEEHDAFHVELWIFH